MGWTCFCKTAACTIPAACCDLPVSVSRFHEFLDAAEGAAAGLDAPHLYLAQQELRDTGAQGSSLRSSTWNNRHAPGLGRSLQS